MAAFGVPASGEGSRWVVPQSGSPRSSSHGVCVKTGSGQQTAGLCGEAAGRPQAMVPVGGGGGLSGITHAAWQLPLAGNGPGAVPGSES